MRLNEWAQAEITSVNKFIGHWMTYHEQDPETYPMDLTDSEWLDEYNLWIDGDDL